VTVDVQAEAINDFYRTVAMNRLYYFTRLRVLRRWCTFTDLVIAIGSSSAVAAWAIWRAGGTAASVWQVIAGAATLIAIAKPFLRLGDEVQRYAELVTGYTSVYFEAEVIVQTAKRMNGVSDALWQSFEQSEERMRKLGLNDDPRAEPRLLQESFDEVNRRMPASDLWWPNSGQIHNVA